MFGRPFRTIVHAIGVAGFLIAALLGSTGPGGAQNQVLQQNCAPHDIVTKSLKDKHQEISHGYGIMNNVFIIEIYTSDKGTWTVVRTDRIGISCILASGHSWETIHVAPGEGV